MDLRLVVQRASEKHRGSPSIKRRQTYPMFIGWIQEVQQEVYRQFGVKLETEVKMVGDFR